MEGFIVVFGVNMIFVWIKLEYYDFDVVYGMMIIYGIIYGISFNGFYRVIL